MPLSLPSLGLTPSLFKGASSCDTQKPRSNFIWRNCPNSYILFSVESTITTLTALMPLVIFPPLHSLAWGARPVWGFSLWALQTHRSWRLNGRVEGPMRATEQVTLTRDKTGHICCHGRTSSRILDFMCWLQLPGRELMSLLC